MMWLTAALFKALDFGSFSQIIRHQYQLPQLIAYVGMFLPALETLVGLSLILEFKIREALWISIAMLAGFCVVIGYGMLGGTLESCGCLGGFDDIEPSWAITRNLALIAMTIWALRFEPHEHISSSWKGWILGAACTLAALTTGSSTQEPHFQKETLVYGKALPELGVDIPNLNEGPVALFIFKAGCSKCWDAMPQIKTLQAEPKLKIIGLTPSDEAEIETFKDTLSPDFPIYPISQETYDNLVKEIPALLLLHHGILHIHLEGRIPTLASIRQFSNVWFNTFLEGQSTP